MDTLKLVFMGTPEFAVPTLKMLLEETEHSVVGVVTQPDKSSGRGQRISMPPIKKIALEYDIQLIQPKKIGKMTRAWLEALQPDCIIVVAYGKILRASVLSIPRLGCINVHASLLPAYRGAAPINWAIINGETQTGITTMHLDEGMDTGDMLLQKTCEILPEDNASSLHDKLAALGAETLKLTLQQIGEGTIQPVKQDESKASYAPMLQKSEGIIRWADSAENIHNRIRGLHPWPGVFTYFRNKRIKLLSSSVREKSNSNTEKPGTICNVTIDECEVATGEGIIILKEVQPESKKPMKIKDFINGYRVTTGDLFTSPPTW